MTTIAWDGRTVAADSLGVCGGDRHANPFQKIIKIYGSPHCKVVGHTGDASTSRLWLEWLVAGADPFNTPYTRILAAQPGVKFEPGSTIVFERGKTAIRYLHDWAFPIEFGVPDAFGTGAGFAIGAMLMGATAEEAVKVAMQRDINTGGAIEVIEL